MAERKTRDLGPHTEKATPKKPEQSLVMDKSSFNNILRKLKSDALVTASFIRNATFLKLKELGVPRDLSKAVKGIPSGSDQADWGSVVTWIKKIESTDGLAIKQLISIDATACSRSL